MSFKIFATGSQITDLEKDLLEDEIPNLDVWLQTVLDNRIHHASKKFIGKYKDKLFDDPNVDSIPANIEGFAAVVTGSSWYENAQTRADGNAAKELQMVSQSLNL
tara:strand:- start:66 stop:380 length:315 start_codon:yes stop_codon:yes gene_type:complete